jgi:hypothetical protein
MGRLERVLLQQSAGWRKSPRCVTPFWFVVSVSRDAVIGAATPLLRGSDQALFLTSLLTLAPLNKGGGEVRAGGIAFLENTVWDGVLEANRNTVQYTNLKTMLEKWEFLSSELIR